MVPRVGPCMKAAMIVRAKPRQKQQESFVGRCERVDLFLQPALMPTETSAGSASLGLHPKCVLQLDQELIRIEPPPIEDRPHVVVVDDEQISDGPECPSQTRVGSYRLAVRVVLDVAGN